MKIYQLIFLLLTLGYQPTYAQSSWPAQWQVTQLPGKPSLRGSAVYQNTFWVSGTDNSVFISTDNGRRWKDISVESEHVTDFRDIEVLSSSSAIVMGVGTGSESRLYITHNSGNSWQLLFENPDKNGFFDSISFWDENNGLLLGDPVDGYYVIMRTNDSGRSWQRVEKTNLPSLINNEAAFAASGNTLITGNQGAAWFTTGGFSASVYTSNDYGKTWLRDSVPLHQSTQTAGGYALALNNYQQLFVMGGDYLFRGDQYDNLARQTKKNWVLPSNGQRGLRTAMACSKHSCIATGKLSSDVSFDQGKSWQPLLQSNNPSVPTEFGFYTLSSNQTFYLGAGAEGKVGVLEIPDSQ